MLVESLARLPRLAPGHADHVVADLAVEPRHVLQHLLDELGVGGLHPAATRRPRGSGVRPRRRPAAGPCAAEATLENTV